MNQSDIFVSTEPDDESDPDEDTGDIDKDLAEEQKLPDIEDVPDESDDEMRHQATIIIHVFLPHKYYLFQILENGSNQF